MSLQPGTRLGQYAITAAIGEGGMGEVYEATDTKLKRQVAIKVLPASVAADADRLARFQREAEVLASLNHPHIAAIFGLEDADGVKALVMELVEGEDLAERLCRGAIPVDEALTIAKQIAEALEQAHEHGIIHRDLKPANIKVTPDGQVKVLDFGLAKALENDDAQATSNSQLSYSPTISRHATQAGMILGTAAYMSPEQARGKPVDRRADVWSFGVVLYEMLTGKRAFEGEDISVTLADVIRAEPAWEKLPTGLSPALVVFVKRCLEKDPRERVQAIGDVRLALAGAFETTSAVTSDALGARHDQDRWNRLTLAFASLFLLAAALAGWALLRPEPRRPLARFESPFRAGQAPIGPFELMRDGSGVVYVGPGEAGGASQLWIRNWHDLDARPIPGTEGASAALNGVQLGLSPDGREVAFAAGYPGLLRVVPLAGGPSRTIAESAFNAAWSHDEWIYFTSGADNGIRRVRSTGGEIEILTEPSEGEIAHPFPRPHPDGNGILFQALRGSEGSDDEVWWLDLETAERKRLTLGNNPRYTASGHLLFGTPDGRLMAVPFDVERAALMGAATPVVEGLLTSGFGHPVYTVSRNGNLAYVAGEVAPEYELVWVTRSGEETAVAAGEKFQLSTYTDGWRLSPDGSRIAFGREADGNTDIWIKELPDGPLSRLTFSDDGETMPQWAPDGQSVTYRIESLGQLWSKRANGSGEPELVFDGLDAHKGVWSPDGDWLVVRRSTTVGDGNSRDILAVRPGVDTVAAPLIASGEFSEHAPAISRDGRWLAHSSDETGRHEIYVRPFPDVDSGKWQISIGGGIQPVWAHNGRELFFASPETGALKAAEFTTTSTSFQRARVTTLFVIPRGRFYFSSAGNNDFYDVALDDERFLMARRYGVDDASRSLILVQNFFEELKRLVPANN